MKNQTTHSPHLPVNQKKTHKFQYSRWLLPFLSIIFILSFFIVLTIIFGSGVWMTIGDVRLLKATNITVPMLFAVVSVIGLHLLHRTNPADIHLTRFPTIDCVFTALIFFMLYQALVPTSVIRGDGREYILQTQSIALHGRLSLDTGAIREYWNATNPYGIELDPAVTASKIEDYQIRPAMGGFPGLFIDRFGGYRFWHPLTYSLAVAPVYALLNAFSSTFAYKSFNIVNTFFLCVPFLLAWFRGRSYLLLFVLGLSLASPFLSYSDWQHPEIFCFSLVYLAFWTIESHRFYLLGPLFLGIAASQNLPIVFFFLLHAAFMWTSWRAASLHDQIKVIFSYLGGTLIALSSTLYFIWYFQCINLISEMGLADISYASLARAAHVFLSPMTGAIWFFPTCFLFTLWGLRRHQVIYVFLAGLLIFAAAWLSSSTMNFNSGQIGAMRYSVWLLAPLWYIAWSIDWKSLTHKIGKKWLYILFTFTVAVNVLTILYFHTYKLLDKDVIDFYTGKRARPEIAAIFRKVFYHDDPETLVENITSGEMRIPSVFSGVYIWNLGENQSLWVISRRAAARMESFIFTSGSSHVGIPEYVTSPPNDSIIFSNAQTLTMQGSAIENWKGHPVFKEYILVRMQAGILDVESNVPVFLRNSYQTNSLFQ